ncbi:hypothetical protein BDN72DRAFT_903037 [Pluteus cervinus]|uniref:Uncharacterized protein n=1 Tax=Pluteus cervinus TaxID=181527 RepID=A0ACD3AB97_9AGAR|nr:hypothetical protein BDN72DRAFT_903037 [Pluteus cervinus]
MSVQPSHVTVCMLRLPSIAAPHPPTSPVLKQHHLGIGLRSPQLPSFSTLQYRVPSLFPNKPVTSLSFSPVIGVPILGDYELAEARLGASLPTHIAPDKLLTESFLSKLFVFGSTPLLSKVPSSKLKTLFPRGHNGQQRPLQAIMFQLPLNARVSHAPSSPLDLCVELQVILLRLVLDNMPVALYHQLMDKHPQLIRRWTLRPLNRILYDDEDIEDFALRVQEFYGVIGPSYPSWRFANLNVLEIPIPETLEVAELIASAFTLVQPGELNLMCGHNKEFPNLLSVLTPCLPNLRTLRIKYERYSSQGDTVYPWMLRSWNTALTPLTKLRMFVLITPLALDLSEPTPERNERQIEQEFISSLTALVPSLGRIYLIYAFDDELGRGDQDRIGLFEQYVKDHGRPLASFPWVRSSVRSTGPCRMPDTDQDVFLREDEGFFDY